MILVVLCLVLYFSLRDNYEEITKAIFNMNYGYVFLAVLILIGYRLCSSCGHYLVIKTNQEQVSFLRVLQINFIILFFHGVTPFAGGGQPMEVYFLHNEHISVTKATNITLQNFIVYQISLVLVGLFALLYNSIFLIFPNDHLIKKLVILGFLVNLLVLVVTFILSFGKKINQVICKGGIHLLAKARIIKDEERVQEDVAAYLTSFHHNALKLKKNKKTILLCILVNIIGLLMLYSMPYMVFRGLGVDVSLITSIVATAYIMVIGSFVPIPGGTGGIEYGFLFFFGYFVKGSILNAVMLVWRFISYYLGMIIGALALSFYRKKERTCE